MSGLRSWSGRAWLLGVYVFLYLPIFFLVAFSFTAGEITGAGVGRIDKVIGVDIDIGVAGADGLNQRAQRLAGQRPYQISRSNDPFGQFPVKFTGDCLRWRCGGAWEEPDHNRAVCPCRR